MGIFPISPVDVHFRLGRLQKRYELTCGFCRRRRPPMSGEWIDVSIAMKSGMVHWPGDPEIKVERVLDMERGDACNVSHLELGSHTGTHMDPPFHYVRGGKTLDEMPLDATMGP